MAGPQPSSQPDTPEALQRSPTPLDSRDGLPRTDAESTLSEVFHDGISGDIRELLRSLPTRADLKALAEDLKDGFQKETQQIRGEISSLNTKMTVQEVEVRTVETSVTVLDQGHVEMEAQLLELRLWLEEQEDRAPSD